MREDKLRILIETVDKASGGLASITKSLVGLGAAYVTWQTAQRIIQAGIDQIGQAVSAAAEQEQADRKLALALRNVGDASASTLKHLKDLAGARQRDTLFTDDQIQGAQSLLISLGRLTGQGLDRATSATLDLAQGLGIDLESAARLVGKAAAGATETFGRYGIIIDESIPKGERFAYILDRIGQKFGGAAQDAAKGYTGALGDLTKQIDELQEALGAAIIDSPAVVAAFKAVANEIARLANLVSDSDFRSALNELAAKLTDVGGRYLGFFAGVAGALGIIEPATVHEIADAIGRINTAVQKAAQPLSFLDQFMKGYKEWKEPSPPPLSGAADQVITLAEYFRELQKITDDDRIQQLLFGDAKRFSGPLTLEPGMADEMAGFEAGVAQVAEHWRSIAESGFSFVSAFDGFDEILAKQQLQLELIEMAQHAAADFAGDLTYAFIQGDLELGKMIKNLLAGLAAAIVRALVLLAIQKAIAAAGNNPAGLAFAFGAGVGSGVSGGNALSQSGGQNSPTANPLSLAPSFGAPTISLSIPVMGVSQPFIQDVVSAINDSSRRFGYRVVGAEAL